jgi:hypothetical protein
MKGYAGLLTILVVTAVCSVVAITVILLGLANSRSSFALLQSSQAKALADGCAEEALLQIHENVSYTGIGTLTLDSGNCDWQVTSGGGQNRTVSTRGFVGTIVRKVTVSVTQITPTITATWTEIP